MHVSGILSIVMLGIYMAKSGKTAISAASEHALHSVWATIGFYAETLIFVLAGLMIGKRNLHVITWENLGKTLMLYVLLHVIRLAVLLLFLPIMNRTGYPMKWRHCVLLTWGALRGALAIFLALLLDANRDIPCEISSIIMFHASAIAMLTLVVNGMTTGLIIEKLGLSKETPTSKKFMYMFVQKVKAHSQKKQALLIEDRKSMGVHIEAAHLANDCLLKETHMRFDKYSDI